MQTKAEDAFSFQTTPLAPELEHRLYCPPCFDAHLGPALEAYAALMVRAKDVFFFFTTQKNRLPVLKRARFKVKVENQADRNETVLRLAFMSVEQGYNAIVEAEVFSEKVRNEGYQKSRWRAIGYPASVDVPRLERHLIRGEG